MAEYPIGGSDDAPIDYDKLQFKSRAAGVVRSDYSFLEEEAESAQRLTMSRLSDRYTAGTMVVTQVDDMRKKTPEKRFHMSKILNWDGAEPTELLDELQKGRLRCRLSAQMGKGKSTRLPTFMARRLECRVLHIALSGHNLQQTSDHINTRGMGHYERDWSPRRRQMLCCMTYAEFNGHMISSRRADLFRSFDIIMMDEGVVETVDVRVAKLAIAAYALPDTSVIIASATASEDTVDGSGSASGVGKFMQVDKSTTVDAVASDPRLVSDWVVDRTAIFVATREESEHMVRVCDNEGLDVRSLDDAASIEDEKAISEWLSGDGSTLRVAVMHMRYGIGFNFPISYALIFPHESKMVFKGDVVTTETVPLTERMLTQVKSRSGRGIADGSGGIVFETERAAVQELNDAERIEAFVTLCAASIIPSRNGYWSAAYEVFPDGLDASVACQLLKVCIHPRIAAKYLAVDGLFAAKYVRALTVFSKPDHYPMTSKHELPMGHAEWPSQKVVGTSGEICVPMLADGELQVVLQAITAMSCGNIAVDRWRSPHVFSMRDGRDSIADYDETKPTQSRLRRVKDVSYALPEIPVKKELPWSYRRGEIADVRVGGILDGERMQQALLNLEMSILEFAINEPTVELIQEEVAEVPAEGIVQSPGGSEVCSLPIAICKKLNSGHVLSPSEFETLIVTVRGDTHRFVQSRVFDMLSRPWDSVLESLLRDDVVGHVAKQGIGTDTYEMVDGLRRRFSTEVVVALSQSNVFKNSFKSFFSRTPNITKIFDALSKGKFEGIAQTRGFLFRIAHLKELIDRVLLCADKNAMFLPTMITAAQRSLPVRGNNVIGYVNDDLKKMPSAWSRAMTGVSVHGRKDKGSTNELGL